MMSTVIGGAMLPHAPQFFTMPDTEDKALVAHVREVAADVGKRLRALEPDLWIIFSNDHAEQFFHTTAPPFTIHVGGDLADVGDQRLVLGVRHGEELRRMGQHGAADHGRHHRVSPCRQGYRAGSGTTSAGAARGSHACARFTGS